MDELIKEILKIGLIPTFLLIILFLVIQNPDRAVKLKALLITPFFRLFRWFSKEYISSKISSQLNEFLNSSVFKHLSANGKYNFRIKWVSAPNDPFFSKNGTLIIRLKEDADQTRNILTAVQSALPHVLCPLIRNNINQTCTKSIDLTVLRKLSEKLGHHGKLIFKKYFLDPETESDQQINELLKKLITLDQNGFFITIFLNELEQLSEGLYAESDKEDYSNQVTDFINYLLTLVNRKIGEEIELEYYKHPFKVSTILLAKSLKANLYGVRPYLKRLNLNLTKGSESIYLISFPPAFGFFDRLLKVLDSHEAIFVRKVIKIHLNLKTGERSHSFRIAVLTRNDVFDNKDFEERLKTNNIREKAIVRGIVEDISANETLVTVLGMRAYIRKSECSWVTALSCDQVLTVGQEYDFIVKSIDINANHIYLSRKFDEVNPWNLIDIPQVGSIIEIKIISVDTVRAICLYKEELEVLIPNEQLSWGFLTDNQRQELIGTTQKAKVIQIVKEKQLLLCSIRQLEVNPWETIHKSITVGTEFNGKVVEITPNFIQVKLPNDLFGILPKEALEKAGHEYAKFEENVVIGQGIDVVISKVFIAKQKIRLDLKRNR